MRSARLDLRGALCHLLTAMTVATGVGISTLFSWAIHHDFAQSGVHGSDLEGLGAAVVTQLAASGQIPSVVCFMLAILGIFAWGHEYRHGMIRASLTALNSRTDLWVAKFVMVGAWVAVVAFVTQVLSGIVGVIYLHDYISVFGGETWAIIGRQVLFGVLLVWLAIIAVRIAERLAASSTPTASIRRTS